MNTQLSTTRTHWQDIFSQLPSGLLVFEVSTGRIVVISHYAETILKLTEAHTFWHTWPLPLKEFRLAMEGPDLCRGEVTIPWPERPRTVGYSLSCLSNLEGTSGDALKVCLFSDITEVIQDRLALDQVKENLYEVKNQATQQTLISATVHELENPVTTLFLELSCLETEVVKAHDYDHLRIVTLDRIEALQKHTQHIGALLSQLQHVAEPPPLFLQPVHPATVIMSLFQQLPRLPRFERMTLTHLLKDIQSCHILVDRLRLEQVLFNLVQHALDQTPPQAIATVEVVGRCDNEQVTISLHYQGMPMHPAIVEAFTSHGVVPEPRLALCDALIKRLASRLNLVASESDRCQTVEFSMSWPINHDAHEETAS